jgi:hypothetical protein
MGRSPRLRCRVALALLVAVSACTSRASAPGSIVVVEPRDPVLSDLRGRQAATGEGAVRDSIAAPPDRAFAALVNAFRDLGIPTEIIRHSTRQVSNTQFGVGRELAGTRLSQLLRCGETLTGPRADIDRVLMSVVSQVRPLGAGSSSVATHVIGVATDAGGTGRRSACSSTGELERRLHDAVKKAEAPSA